MNFPPINIKSSDITLTPQIQELVEKRLGTLGKLIPKGETDVLCEVELGRVTAHREKGDIYRAETNLKIGGNVYRAEAEEETIERAIDKMKNELKHELSNVKGRREGLLKRGGRKAKELFRFGGE